MAISLLLLANLSLNPLLQLELLLLKFLNSNLLLLLRQVVVVAWAVVVVLELAEAVVVAVVLLLLLLLFTSPTDLLPSLATFNPIQFLWPCKHQLPLLLPLLVLPFLRLS